MNKRKNRIKHLMKYARKYGFKVSNLDRIIHADQYDSIESIPTGPRYYIGQLLMHGYTIQFKLFV